MEFDGGFVSTRRTEQPKRRESGKTKVHMNAVMKDSEFLLLVVTLCSP
jgi:hypothetical protein